MHRSYQSVLPNTNKLLKKRWDDAYYNQHRKNVAEAGPMVNTNPPQAYIHLHMRLKKQQIEEERLATIERDNRILLEKMSNIMRTKGRIDNKNEYQYKSLNREKRSRELLRVMQENQEILRRITSKKPEYDVYKWENEWQENLRYMDAISAFPPEWWKNRSNSSPSPMNRQKSTVSSRSNFKKEKNDKRGKSSSKKQTESIKEEDGQTNE